MYQLQSLQELMQKNYDKQKHDKLLVHLDRPDDARLLVGALRLVLHLDRVLLALDAVRRAAARHP